MICNAEETERYVGSTKYSLARRIANHRYYYKKWKDGKSKYVSSFSLFERYGVENCKIMLIEEVDTDDVKVLRAREQHYIDTMECVNQCRAMGDKKAYRKAYYEINKEKHNKWEKENREKRNAQRRAWYQAKKALKQIPSLTCAFHDKPFGTPSSPLSSSVVPLLEQEQVAL